MGTHFLVSGLAVRQFKRYIIFWVQQLDEEEVLAALRNSGQASGPFVLIQLHGRDGLT